MGIDSYGKIHKPVDFTQANWDEFVRRRGGLEKPVNYKPKEWEDKLEWEVESYRRELAAHPDHFTIKLRSRTFENRWTRYRTKVLETIGLSDDEISELKYNRLTNLRVAWFLKEIKAEVVRIQTKYNLTDYAAAANYRRDHYEDLLDAHDIEDWDPYRRMGYLE